MKPPIPILIPLKKETVMYFLGHCHKLKMATSDGHWLREKTINISQWENVLTFQIFIIQVWNCYVSPLSGTSYKYLARNECTVPSSPEMQHLHQLCFMALKSEQKLIWRLVNSEKCNKSRKLWSKKRKRWNMNPWNEYDSKSFLERKCSNIKQIIIKL